MALYGPPSLSLGGLSSLHFHLPSLKAAPATVTSARGRCCGLPAWPKLQKEVRKDQEKQPFINRTSGSTQGTAQGCVFQPTHGVSWTSCLHREREFPPVTHTSQAALKAYICTSHICLLGHPCGLVRNGCRVRYVSPRCVTAKTSGIDV